MGMTEKQGGTDVRANTTTAAPAGNGGPGAEYLITGHKWFMSAPMCDAFLVLAQAPGGLSCFLMPRFLPDGTVNALRFQRLKDKLGNRSNASSEVEFQGAHAWLIGEEGRGVPAIIEMVTGTRLDCAVASAGLMRAALANAIHHCRHRTVFSKPLVDQPLMQQVLADLALDVEAATALALPPGAQLRSRLRRACGGVAPADDAGHQVLGVQDRPGASPTRPWSAWAATATSRRALAARIYRELPLNAIWEGSGNVMALDLLRVLQREPETVEIVMDDLAAAVGGDAHLKAHLARVQSLLHEPRLLDKRGRDLAEALALLAARHDPARACADGASPTPSSPRACLAPDARPTGRGWTGRIRARSSSGPTRTCQDAGVLDRSERPRRLMARTISPSASMKSPRWSVRSTDRMRWSTLAAIGRTEPRADFPLAVSRTAYMRASRRVRLRCSRPFFTRRRTMSASVERSTPVCSTRPVWLMSGFCATLARMAYWRGRQLGADGLVGEQHLRALTCPVQQMQRRGVELPSDDPAS